MAHILMIDGIEIAFDDSKTTLGIKLPMGFDHAVIHNKDIVNLRNWLDDVLKQTSVGTEPMSQLEYKANLVCKAEDAASRDRAIYDLDKHLRTLQLMR